MDFPTAERYTLYVQNPETFFTSPRITASKVTIDPYGLPDVLSGGFAYTYRFDGPNGALAVRCFHKSIADLMKRSSAIALFLKKLNSKYFVHFAFEQAGIKAEGQTFPVVEMEWVTGNTLLGFINENYRASNALAQIRQQLREYQTEQSRFCFSHGDIQLRNIMVTNSGAIKFVDYDSMYVPALKGLSSADLGNPHFQSPARTNDDFNEKLDRFGLIVLEISLRALQEDPTLFERYHQGENLILTSTDFRNPASSSALKEIANLREVGVHALRFFDICGKPLNEIPTLDEFYKETSATEVGSWWEGEEYEDFEEEETYISNFDVLDGNDFDTCADFIGKQVEIVGLVQREFLSGRLMILRFGEKYHRVVAVAVPNDVFVKITNSAAKKWISVSGVLQKHRVANYTNVQILLRDASDLQFISSDEYEFRLGRKKRLRTARRQIKKTALEKATKDKLTASHPFNIVSGSVGHKRNIPNYLDPIDFPGNPLANSPGSIPDYLEEIDKTPADVSTKNGPLPDYLNTNSSTPASHQQSKSTNASNATSAPPANQPAPAPSSIQTTGKKSGSQGVFFYFIIILLLGFAVLKTVSGGEKRFNPTNQLDKPLRAVQPENAGGSKNTGLTLPRPQKAIPR